MNEAFNSVLDIGTSNNGTKEGKRLSFFNLIDVGMITGVTNGRCSVQSYKVVNGGIITYDDLELIYPGGVGNFNPEGMSCIVFFPAETVNLKDKTISTLKPYFSAFGGKVIPITVEGESNVKVGPNFDGSYCVSSKDISLRLSESKLSLSIQNKLSINGDASSLEIVMANGGTYLVCDYINNTVIQAHLNGGTPFYYDVLTATEHWIGHVGYKAMSHNDIKYDITKYVKTDFNFVEDFISTEQWIYIYKNDGSVLASLCIDNTGEIYVGTEEKITVEAKKDVTVNRDGTKLEVKNGKVVITGDLEVSGKTTITGMKTDVQKFFDDLTSALNSMYTLGSPATHNTDGGFKSNITLLRSKL